MKTIVQRRLRVSTGIAIALAAMAALVLSVLWLPSTSTPAAGQAQLGGMTGGGRHLADLNADGFSDITDISLLAGTFGETVPPAPLHYDVAPATQDGLVDISDLATIAAFFGQSTPLLASVPVGDIRVTHGFELDCDKSEPNRLEVNWGANGKGDKFHLEILDTASCSDDPDIDEGEPIAGFDTYVGSGTGRFNGVSGATATWTFTDAGEPGKDVDGFIIAIKDKDGNPVLSVAGVLDVGNHQAHPVE